MLTFQIAPPNREQGCLSNFLGVKVPEPGTPTRIALLPGGTLFRPPFEVLKEWADPNGSRKA